LLVYHFVYETVILGISDVLTYKSIFVDFGKRLMKLSMNSRLCAYTNNDFRNSNFYFAYTNSQFKVVYSV